MNSPTLIDPRNTIPPTRIGISMLRQWKMVLAVALGAAGVLFMLIGGRQPQYQAEASLRLRTYDDKGPDFSKLVKHTGGEANSILYVLNAHRVDMKSSRFLDFFYVQLSPEEREDFVAPPANPAAMDRILGILSSTPPTISGGPGDKTRVPFRKLCETADVDFVKGSLTLKVSVKHHDPEQAAALATAWVKAYAEYAGQEEGASPHLVSIYRP
jgi:uncharacterized protein involved in exopolysaccharide biosynthesis